MSNEERRRLTEKIQETISKTMMEHFSIAFGKE